MGLKMANQLTTDKTQRTTITPTAQHQQASVFLGAKSLVFFHSQYWGIIDIRRLKPLLLASA